MTPITCHYSPKERREIKKARNLSKKERQIHFANLAETTGRTETAIRSAYSRFSGKKTTKRKTKPTVNRVMPRNVVVVPFKEIVVDMNSRNLIITL